MSSVNGPSKLWFRKRRLTIIGFTIQCVFLGMEYSLTFLTLYLYIKTLVKPQAPKLMYGIVSASYLLSAVLFSLVFGRLVDKSRRVGIAFFAANLCVIIGNIAYALPFSVVYLIIGRFVSGIGGILRSVITGEVARIYDSTEATQKMALMGTAYGLGFVLGPAVNYLFKNTHIEFGEWIINYTNAPSLFLAMVFIILQTVNVFIINNVSREFDLKDFNRKCKQRKLTNGYVNKTYSDISSFKMNVSENDLKFVHSKKTEGEKPSPSKVEENHSIEVYSLKENKSSKQLMGQTRSEKSLLIGTEEGENLHRSSFRTIFTLAKQFDVLLLMLSAAFTSYYIICFEIWLTLVITDVFHWTIVELTSIIFAIGVGCALMCLFFVKRSLSGFHYFVLAIFSFLTMIFCHAIFLIFKYLNTKLVTNIVLLSLFVVFYVLQIYIEDIFLVTTIAQLVEPDIQTSADAARLAFSRIGSLVALLCSAIVFDYLVYVSIVGVIILLVGVTLLVFRKNVFIQRKVLL